MPQVAAFLPATGKFVEDEEVDEPRAKGSLQDPKISLTDPKKVSLLPVRGSAWRHIIDTSLGGSRQPAHVSKCGLCAVSQILASPLLLP